MECGANDEADSTADKGCNVEDNRDAVDEGREAVNKGDVLVDTVTSPLVAYP